MKVLSAGIFLLLSAFATGTNAATPDGGIFTLQQARAGESVYLRECSSCHGVNLAGGEEGMALLGTEFLGKWSNLPLSGLYAVTQGTMPKVNPGGLSAAQYRQVVAYMLLANGYPPGDRELSGGIAELSAIQLPSPSGDAQALLAKLDGLVQASNQESVNWAHVRGDEGSSNYSALDQINADNVSKLNIAWRWKAHNFGASPEFNFQSTPIMVKGRIYTTAGTRRDAVAIDAATGETLWMHRIDEGERGNHVPRRGSGRGVAYTEINGQGRIYYITPGYRLVGLDAASGQPLKDFGDYGVIDLKTQLDQEVDLVRDPIGASSAPVIVKGVVIVGSAFPSGRAPSSKKMVAGHILGFDAVTGKRRWIFHTVPQEKEVGVETWEQESWRYTGNTGAWTQLSADSKLGLVYIPVEAPTGDYYGGHRPGDNLFSQSLVALDAVTGKRVWHYQTVRHDIWDLDPPAAPVLYNYPTSSGVIPAIAQVTKQGLVFAFDRRNGKPIWPIEDRKVPASTVPGEKTAATQPFPTLPKAFAPLGMTEEWLNDLTPEIHAEAKRIGAEYTLGPLFTPPTVVTKTNKGTISLPGTGGAANWPGAVVDQETSILYVGSAMIAKVVGMIKSPRSDMNFVGSSPRIDGPFGLPLNKPPYGTITAIDMKSGKHLWQIANGDTPDYIKSNPKLEGVNLPPTGHPERARMLVTRTLLFAGEGSGLYVSGPGGGGKKFRAHDKQTGKVLWEMELPANASGTPMTYSLDGEQYIVVPVGARGVSGELVALKLTEPGSGTPANDRSDE